jgi:dUTP pyrophosphatase
VPTGIAIRFPPGVYGRIAPRSSLAWRHRLDVGAGVVDPDYTGEIMVLLINNSEDVYIINYGDRVAQLIFERFEIFDLAFTTEEFTSPRGGAGFGSTGI